MTISNNPYSHEKYIFENVIIPLQNTRDGVLQAVGNFNQTVVDFGAQINLAVANSTNANDFGNSLQALGEGMQTSNNARTRVAGAALESLGKSINGVPDDTTVTVQDLAAAGLSAAVAFGLPLLGAALLGAAMGAGMSVGAGLLGASVALGALGLIGGAALPIAIVTVGAFAVLSASDAIANYAADLVFGDVGPLSDYNFNIPVMSLFSADPLVLDLNGDGIALSSVASSTAYFDYNNDGFREKTGWMSSGDGVLVRDLNGNG